MQGRVTPAFDAPALVVGEVQVKPVQLVGGQHVDEAQQHGLGEEMPGHVKMRAAPGQGGRIVDLRARQLPRRTRHRRGPVGLVGEKLPDGLRRVERAGLSPGGDPHVARADAKLVALVRQPLVDVDGDAAGIASLRAGSVAGSVARAVPGAVPWRAPGGHGSAASTRRTAAAARGAPGPAAIGVSALSGKLPGCSRADAGYGSRAARRSVMVLQAPVRAAGQITGARHPGPADNVPHPVLR